MNLKLNHFLVKRQHGDASVWSLCPDLVQLQSLLTNSSGFRPRSSGAAWSTPRNPQRWSFSICFGPGSKHPKCVRDVGTVHSFLFSLWKKLLVSLKLSLPLLYFHSSTRKQLQEEEEGEKRERSLLKCDRVHTENYFYYSKKNLHVAQPHTVSALTVSMSIYFFITHLSFFFLQAKLNPSSNCTFSIF